MPLLTSLVRHWNTEGMQESPYGMTQYWKWPKVVLKAIFHSSPSQMWNRLYALCRSSLVKIFIEHSVEQLRRQAAVDNSASQWFGWVFHNLFRVKGHPLFLLQRKILLMWEMWKVNVPLMQCFLNVFLHCLLFSYGEWINKVAWRGRSS